MQYLPFLNRYNEHAHSGENPGELQRGEGVSYVRRKGRKKEEKLEEKEEWVEEYRQGRS